MKDLSFADLYAMYQFVVSDFHQSFGGNKEALRKVSEKKRELEEEMYLRTYGENPYTVTVNGEDPEKVIRAFNPVSPKIVEDDPAPKEKANDEND